MLCGLSPLVCAETISGTIGPDGEPSSLNYVVPAASSGNNAFIDLWYTKYIEKTIDTNTVVYFTPATFGGDANAKSGASTTFLMYRKTNYNGGITGDPIGGGTIGYQRKYNYLGTQIGGGYVYIVLDWWNVTGLSGAYYLKAVYDQNALYNSTIVGVSANTNAEPALDAGILSPIMASASPYALNGSFIWNKVLTRTGSYTVTKPLGIGISGYVNKVGNSRIFITDTAGSIVSSEMTLNNANFSFQAAQEQIIISLLTPEMQWYNSSILFAAPAPTVTPTITPSGTPVTPQNPIAPGYVRSMAECVDGTTNGRMGGCAVSLKDVEAGTWANSSTVGWDYGYYWIDTLPNHTIDAYGVLSGYSPVSRTGEPASGTRMIELVMWDISLPGPSTAGMVVLNVLANDIESGYALPGATVQVKDGATGITYTETTPTSGTARFEVTNKSTSYITVKKYGYVSKTVTLETSDFGPDTKRVELERATVTTGPTPTIPVGGVTTAVTVDPVGTPDPAGGPSGYSNAKGQQMMDYLAAHGMDLVQLCFLVTILGLMGIKLGK